MPACCNNWIARPELILEPLADQCRVRSEILDLVLGLLQQFKLTLEIVERRLVGLHFEAGIDLDPAVGLGPLAARHLDVIDRAFFRDDLA